MFGWQEATRFLVKKTDTRLKIYGLTPKLGNILKRGPVVVAANHPYEAETLALIASLPSRKDAYLIINVEFYGYGEAIDKHLIPVYIQHHPSHKKTDAYLYSLVRLFNPITFLSADAEHNKNIKSIGLASRIVEKGGLVMIYPGRRNAEGNWYPGIGHLLYGVKKNRLILLMLI